MGRIFTDRSRRKLIKGVAVLTSGALASQLLSAGANQYGVEGQVAPELEISYWIDRDGNPTTFSLAAERGKWVMLKLFQDWYPGCHSSGFPTLQTFAAEFADHPRVAIASIQTVFEGFGSNTLEDVRKNQIRYQLPITMGHDPGDANGDHRPHTMRAFRTGGTPWIILIRPDGRVVYNHFHVNTERLIDYVGSRVG